jgi:hypothetical protein
MAACDDETASSCGGRYVMLPGGFSLPIEPLLFALELQARGVRFWRNGHYLEYRGAIGAGDVQRLRRWKWHLLAIVDHDAMSRDVQ